MLFKLNDPSTRQAIAAMMVSTFAKLTDIEELSVGVPANADAQKSWDLSVVIGVPNLALMEQLLASNTFTTFFEKTMNGRFTVTKAWSFERLQ
ncbi:MAG: hypothetical protein ABW352_11940 [Polyangiales bacterium]